MIRELLISVFILTQLTVQAQTGNKNLVNRLDELLLDSRYEEVIKEADQTNNQDAFQDILIRNKKAEALIRLGKFDAADNLLKETVNKISQVKNAGLLTDITQTNIGFLYLNQGRNDLALETLSQAASALTQNNSGLETAQTLSYLGQVYIATGKYIQAIEQLQMALSIRQDKLPATHELIAASYNDLGFANSQVDVNKALDYYEKAAAMYEKLHGMDHPKMAIANTNLGRAYFSLELYGDAINYYEAALGIWEKVYKQAHPSKAFVLTNLGLTYAKTGDNKAALGYYEKALAIYIESQGKKHPDVAYTYNIIGNILKSEDKYDSALSNYQKAIISNVSDFNSRDIKKNPSFKNYYNGNVLLYSMMYKAQALEARHLGKTLKVSDLTLGLSTLQVCDTLIDKLRQQTTNESDKITLGSIANEVYADGVRIAYLLSDVSFTDRKEYQEQSFYFAEKSKSAVLQEAISNTNAKSFANIPPALLEEEKSLKSAMALITQKLAQKPSAEEEKYLRETAFHLNQSYSNFTSQLEKNYPEYFNLKFNSASPAISQLKNLLDSKTALISYFIDDRNSRLYTFVITNKKFTITNQPLPAEYDKYISGFRNSLYFMEEKAFIFTSRNLYRLLIPKGIPASINSLVVLPSGRMSVIPFEALLTQNVQDPSTPFKKLPYLIQKYNIRYEFSAGLLLQKKETRVSTLTSAKLFAPIIFPEKDNLNNLPGTQKEVTEIQGLFKSKNIICDVLTEKNASETAIKDEKLKDFSLIHFATHGIVDEENPELSRIFLQNDSETEDGNLFSGEIYNLHLNANLVTLSACQTGLGKISKGEGVIGLSRALVYAGAKNIIVSFWSVADESTAELMMNFYERALQTGSTSFSEGLRAAKLDFLNEGKYAAPYYWAPFILIGF